MIPAAFSYHRAEAIEDALDALAEPEAKALAGGQSLLPLLKLRVVRPALLVDLGRLELRGCTRRDGEVRIGALTTWSDLATARDLEDPGLAALAECAAGIGDLQVRNRGTVAGSVAHADPASDLPAVILALGGRLLVRSREGERELAAADLFLGPYTTSLAPGELIAEVVVPVPADGSGSAYVSVEHPASGFALAGAAALVAPDGETTVALTGVGAQPFALPPEREPEDALADSELYGDRFAPAEYRRQLARVVVRRALERARQRAGDAT